MAKQTKNNPAAASTTVPETLAETVKPGATAPGKDDCCKTINNTLQTGVTVKLSKPVELKKTLPDDEFHNMWSLIVPVDKNADISPRINFSDYRNLIDRVLLPGSSTATVAGNLPAALGSAHAYALIQFTTETYVRRLANSPSSIPPPPGVSPSTIQFIIDEVEAIAGSSDVNRNLYLGGLVPVELIWSYWHEEGMLVQTMNAIIKRFQNMRNGANDPLGALELDPLRRVSNILWGYIQQLPFRLTVKRRAYEYDHHYGLRIFGKAISEFNPADSRSRFLEAFHNLLYKCTIYFKEADDMTINADAFPLLNALAEVHRQLAEGMHNQYSDMPLIARSEMLIDQYILSRQEIWEFLRGRTMVLYDEPWMGAVDCMKTLQGWPSTSITYYRDLGTLGENILLTIRFTPWTRISSSAVAGAWATLLRDSIQQYIYSYQAVTGVDLSVDKSNQHHRDDLAAMPGILISQKMQQERMYRKL